MTSRTVKSPVGASIEIVENDDWALTAGVSVRSLQMWSRSKPLVVRELWEHGPATEPNGRATAVLFDRIESHYPRDIYKLAEPGAVNALMTDTANAAAFKRDITGKRCYSLSLVAMPEIWYEKLMRDIGDSMPTFTATPVESNGVSSGWVPSDHPDPIEETAALIALDRLPELEPVDAEPVIEVEVASQVAMELLTRVVEIISAGSAAEANPELRRLRNELVHSQGLLSSRLSENDKMRKQLSVTGDELRAVKLERDSLRTRLRQTEANLNAALKGESAHAVTTEVMKRVDRIMRETPHPSPKAGEG